MKKQEAKSFLKENKDDEMKKNLAVYLVLMLLLLSALISFSGCSAKIDIESGYEIFVKALENSFEHEVYYYREYTYGESTKFTEVNLRTEADENGYIKDTDGNFVNYSLTVFNKSKDKTLNEIYVGQSTSINEKDKKNVAIYKYLIDGKLDYSKVTEATTKSFVDSNEFKSYTLRNKFNDLTEINFEDINQDYKTTITKNGVMYKYKIQLKDTFFERFKENNGKESVLKGAFLEIEIAYDRITKFVVYEKRNLDSNFSDDFEVYKIENAYLGKKIWIPSYDDSKLKIRS